MQRAAYIPLVFLLINACGPGDGSSPEPVMQDTVGTMTTTPSVEELAGMMQRLLGEWNDVRSDEKTVFHEQWTQDDAKNYTGLGFVMSGTDTVFIEHLKIHWDSTGAWYSAMIPSQNDGLYVDFSLEHASPDSIVFVDPTHDFPQRISYTLERDGNWTVVVSGIEQDAFRVERFRFTRRTGLAEKEVK